MTRGGNQRIHGTEDNNWMILANKNSKLGRQEAKPNLLGTSFDPEQRRDSPIYRALLAKRFGCVTYIEASKKRGMT